MQSDSLEKAKAFIAHSQQEPEDFWSQKAELIEWERPFDRIFDGSSRPHAYWYPGGRTNLCYNAIDRHAAIRPDQPALIYVSTETGAEEIYSFAELRQAVSSFASALVSRGIGKGDRVLIYMPMVAEAIIAMLATVRIGAVHSVVFGGFAPEALATRIDDLHPDAILYADAGLRNGKVIAYESFVAKALNLAEHTPNFAVRLDRKLADEHCDLQIAAYDWRTLAEQFADADAPIVWVESEHPSYILYTSGTTGRPKGVQRDTGGHAVALAASIRHIYDGKPGETFFATSDIGWVVGHSYSVYGPLLAGMATLIYEGTPANPDPGIWWRLIKRHNVTTLFTSPTAMRMLKGFGESHVDLDDLSGLRNFFVAGEPLDVATSQWISNSFGRPALDHYWQTETGWPIVAPLYGVSRHPVVLGSPGMLVYGYQGGIIDGQTMQPVETGEKGMLAIKWPLPPGSMTTIWRDDARFREAYFRTAPDGTIFYLTNDFATVDDRGFIKFLGRTDDVINVAGHRLGTREIEESLCKHPGILEAAVVAQDDVTKGQVPVAFLVLRDTALASSVVITEAKNQVSVTLGAIAKPTEIGVLSALPKTRSGKVLRRALQAIVSGEEPTGLTTLEDTAPLKEAAQVVESWSRSESQKDIYREVHHFRLNPSAHQTD